MIVAEIDRNNFSRRGGELMPRELMERAADPALVPDEALVAVLANIAEIRLLDHLVLGEGKYVSIRSTAEVVFD